MLVMVKSKKNKSKFVLNKICFRMFFDANVVVKILLSKYISKFFLEKNPFRINPFKIAPKIGKFLNYGITIFIIVFGSFKG